MKLFTCTTLILGASTLTAGVAMADIMWDQIGEYDGSGIGANIMACQDFEAGFDTYDVVVADNFTGDGSSIDMLEMVVGGWAGFVDPSGVTGYTANLYSSDAQTGISLVGDIDSNYVDAANVTIDANWTGANFLLALDPGVTSVLGDQLIGLIPANEYATNGQTGCADSAASDGTNAIQGNPGGGFGFGTWQAIVDADGVTPVDGAYRIGGYVAGDPCNLPLPETCTADVDGDMVVSVTDILAIVGNWGVCGDGLFRPVGDVAPLPNGDCCVNVEDLLAVIGSWGDDCTPRGACCSDMGVCTEMVTIDTCTFMGGQYLGDGSTCADGLCLAGACCMDDVTCSQMSSWYCIDSGGIFRGDGTNCLDISCSSDCDATGCQLPDLAGHGVDGIIGATSDTNAGAGYVVADTFHPTADGDITQACWWGLYIDFGLGADCGVDGPGTGDNFTITYYLDDADSTIPGTMFAGPFAVSASVMPTGGVIPSGIGDIVQYTYTASHPSVNVQSGMCYWISISNETTGSCFWLWETAPQGDGRSAQDNDGWGTSDYDLGFCVNVDTSSDACGVFTGPCCLTGEVCVIMSELDCITAEGVYKGDNLSCADSNDCQPIPGACCFPNTCIQNTTDEECIAFEGKFMGENTTCDDVDCTPNPYDQVGSSDGGDLDGNITASQIFDDANAAYNIATLDNFTFDEQATITSIEAVIDGWNGFTDISSITNYTISVYSSPDAAGTDLVGDVYSVDIVSPVLPEWTGDGTLVMFDINVVLPAGTYYFAVIPWNDYGTDGQTGIAGSILGDGTCYQANPNGGFGFGMWQETDGNAGYRIGTQ